MSDCSRTFSLVDLIDDREFAAVEFLSTDFFVLLHVVAQRGDQQGDLLAELIVAGLQRGHGRAKRHAFDPALLRSRAGVLEAGEHRLVLLGRCVAPVGLPRGVPRLEVLLSVLVFFIFWLNKDFICNALAGFLLLSLKIIFFSAFL